MPARLIARAISIALLACAIVGVPGSVLATPEPVTALFLVGGSPNFPRLVNVTGATEVVSATESAVTLRVTVGVNKSWWLNFAAPSGAALGPGTYPAAEGIAGPGVPGLDVYGGDGFGCGGGSAGEFTVHELVRNGAGILSAFAADFSLKCTGFTPSPDRVLSGEVRYQSSIGRHAWSATPTSIAFPDQAPGTTSPTQYVTLTNVGSLPLDFDAAISGLSQPEFVVDDSNDCLDGPLAVSESCQLGVAYLPWRATPAEGGQLKITRQGIAGILPVALTGTGKSPTTTQLILHSAGYWPSPASFVQTVVSPPEGGYVTINDADTGVEYSRRFVGHFSQFEFPLPLPWGVHNLVAHYLGSDSAFPSDSEIVQAPRLIATETTLMATEWVDMGEAIELYATVKSPGTFRLSGGTLSIVDLETDEVVTSIAVSDDYPEARAVIRLFEVGLFHQFEARYTGHGLFAASSGRADVSVTAATQVAAAVSDTFVPAGSQVTISGDVTAPTSQQPSGGTLAIHDADGNVIVSKNVTASDRHIQTTVTVAAGTHRFDVVYSGDNNFGTSTASVLVEAEQTDSVGPLGSVSVNSGAAYTTARQVTLTLSATDPAPGTGVASMQFSFTGAAQSWTTAEAYATAKVLSLSGADGTNTVYVRFSDGAGNLTVASDSIVLDTTPPTTPTPQHGFLVGSQIGTSLVPVGVSFGTTDLTSGITGYAAAQSTNAGATWTAIALPGPLTTSVVRNLAPGSASYRFRASAMDGAGNASPWGLSDTTSLVRMQESSSSVTYTGGWAVKSATQASGRKYRTARRAASAFVTFTGSDIGLVMRVGPNCGQIALYLDGATTPLGTVDLYSANVGWRRVVHSISLPSSALHRLEIRVLGTKAAPATGTQVGLDALVVLR